jgi:hypothetical protein
LLVVLYSFLNEFDVVKNTISATATKDAVARGASASSSTENKLYTIHYCKLLLYRSTDSALPNEMPQSQKTFKRNFPGVNRKPVKASKVNINQLAIIGEPLYATSSVGMDHNGASISR